MSLQLSLSDAISRFHEVSQATHQFWAYFQFVAAGAVTVAWAVPVRGEKGLCWLLTAGLTAFAAANGVMVYKSQQDMYAVAAAIDACVNKSHACTVSPDLLPVVNSIGAAEPCLIALAYVGLFAAALVGIWLPSWQRSLLTR